MRAYAVRRMKVQLPIYEGYVLMSLDYHVAASILAADFARLGAEIDAMFEAGVNIADMHAQLVSCQ